MMGEKLLCTVMLDSRVITNYAGAFVRFVGR